MIHHFMPLTRSLFIMHVVKTSSHNIVVWCFTSSALEKKGSPGNGTFPHCINIELEQIKLPKNPIQNSIFEKATNINVTPVYEI